MKWKSVRRFRIILLNLIFASIMCCAVFMKHFIKPHKINDDSVVCQSQIAIFHFSRRKKYPFVKINRGNRENFSARTRFGNKNFQLFVLLCVTNSLWREIGNKNFTSYDTSRLWLFDCSKINSDFYLKFYFESLKS